MRALLLSISLFVFATTFGQNSKANKSEVRFPAESELHEGTWLQWPHHYQYGIKYRKNLDDTWVSITAALITSENVHIIAYNQTEKSRIEALLKSKDISLKKINFIILKTDDVWIRDNGPIFVKDKFNHLIIEDWGFNAWGNDAKFEKCNQIPQHIALELSLPLIELNNIILEGGSFETDGNGTLIATRSSIVHKSRNPDKTELEIEAYLMNHLGTPNIIWLDGKYGTELTDMHIDGLMKFANDSTILTMSTNDLLYWGLSKADINTLNSACNIDAISYNKIELPLTQFDVKNTRGKSLGYKGSYCNFYIANKVILVPNYNDSNDKVANKIIQSLYPNRNVIGIDARNLYQNGGMIHCVTMQQPEN